MGSKRCYLTRPVVWHSLFVTSFILLAMGTATADDDIAQLVAQLDADEFTVRQQASEKLAELGGEAVDELQAAAVGTSLEVTSRAIQILEQWMSAPEPALRNQAKAALDQLAKSDSPSAARRAQRVLETAPSTAIANPFGNRIQVQIQMRAAAVQRGKRAVQVQANGKHIAIEIDQAGKIKMSVTEKKDGKDVTEKYEADNAADLKKKHPAAYELYQKYAERKGVIGGAFRAPAVHAVAPKAAREKTIESIQASIKRLDETAKRNPQMREAVERHKKMLRKNLDRLQAPPEDKPDEAKHPDEAKPVQPKLLPGD